jgi:hypothetical protein
MKTSPVISKLVWVKSGGMCAFPSCRLLLVEIGNGSPDVLIGEVAHIAGRSEDGGPRTDGEVPGGDRNGVANLLLLCPTHHELVDKQPQTYTVERLVGMKEAHERWVREVWTREQAQTAGAGVGGPEAVTETVHSTLLPVDLMPRFIYVGPCDLAERDVRRGLRTSVERGVMLPFIVRERKVIAFADLSNPLGPFADVITAPSEAVRHAAADWWKDPNLARWYVELLNRALNKLTGRRGLNFDKEHRRYYFEPNRDEAKQPLPRTVTYRPLNQALSEKSVVWQPVSRRTGQPRGLWTHLAVGLRFHRLSPTRWVLSLRPERRFTIDGTTPLAAKRIGSRSTREKAHMYNYDVLTELQFWKEFLSSGEPRIIFSFGGQSLVLNAELMTVEVQWPGVPEDARPFTNVTSDDDLFSQAAYNRALAEVADPDVELDALEETDLAAFETDDDLPEDQPS